MGHLAAKESYQRLRERLDMLPVGAPGRGAIFQILKILYTPEEAELAAKLPLRFASLQQIARKLSLPESELQSRLEAMADKGLVADFNLGGKIRYILNPTIVGAFEFSMMRVRADIDQEQLAGLMHQYLIGNSEFADALKKGAPTSLFRTMVHEETLPADYTEVLDWERASHIVENAGAWSIGLCHCRHVAHHLDRECEKFPMDTCLSLGMGAEYLSRHGLARSVEKQEAIDLLQRSREAGLVHLGDNVQNRPSFICNCCSCCCEVMQGFRKFRAFQPFASNFEAQIDAAACNGCRKCARACPVNAIEVIEQVRVQGGKKLKWLARVDPEICIGCGVCAQQCKFDSLKMAPRERRWITPANTFAKVLTMALEQGKLQHLLLDQDDGLGARTASALLGAILKLPPTKQLLARDAFKSRFVDFMLQRAGLGSKKQAR